MIVVDAGNLPRVLACLGSLNMQPDPIYSQRDNTIREEGNAAHWMASTIFAGQYTAEELTDRKAPNGVYITDDIAEHVHDYLSTLHRHPQSVRHMEWGYTLNGQNYQINGRADHIELDRGTLYIDDFKYGYTVVEPEMNWTLLFHAIGYCIEHNIAPDNVSLIIHQPRAPHPLGRVRSWPISYTRLTELFHEASAKLNNPDNMLHTGTHCYRCPSFASCPARQKAELNGIEMSHTAYNAEISDDDLSFRLDQIHRAKKLLEQSEKAYQEQALHRISKGKVINNYSIDDEIANRSWKDGATPELLKILTGKDLSKSKLITPRQAEQMGVSEELTKLWTERKLKGKKLVRVSANAKAKQMFGDK